MSAVSVDSLNVVLELTYHMQRDGGYRIQVRVEPSQAEDLEAIFFGFNFHHDLTGGFGSYKDVERGMRIPDWMHQEVDRVSSSILERSRSVGGI